MNGIGKILIVMGLVFLLAGAILVLAGKFPGFKSLPGDIIIKRANFSIYFPIGTSLLISLILTLVIFLWRKFGA